MAYQFVRKITGVTKPTGVVHDDMHADSARGSPPLAHALLDRPPCPSSAPEDGVAAAAGLEVRARMGLEPFPA